MIYLKRGTTLATLGVLTVLGTNVANAYAATQMGSTTQTVTTQSTTSNTATITDSPSASAQQTNTSAPKLTKADATKIATSFFPDVFHQQGSPNVQLQSNYDGKQVYQIMWNQEMVGSPKGPQFNHNFSAITVDANTGEILSFSHNNQAWVDITNSISMAKAQSLAKSWLEKLAPTKHAELVLAPESGDTGGNFTFQFVRKVNGVLAPFDAATITLTSNGDLENYSLSWHHATFPAVPNSIVSQSAAAKTYQDNLKLQLAYQSAFIQNGQGPLQLVYVPMSSQTESMLFGSATPTIDATTGKLLGMDGKPVTASGVSTDKPLDSQGPTDWPSPLKTALTESQAKQQVMQDLSLSSTDWTLNNSQDATGENGAIGSHQAWQFDFINQKSESDLNVDIDATDGVLVNVNNSSMMGNSGSGKPLTDAQLQADADAFVKRIFPHLTGAIRRVQDQKMYGPSSEAMYTYDFLKNGIPVNGFNVTLNPTSGKVQFYQLMQDPTASFPSTSDVISSDAATQVYMKDAGPVLQYMLPETLKNVVNGSQMQYGTSAMLVYAQDRSPMVTDELNATTGKWVEYAGSSATPATIGADANPEAKAMAELEANGIVTSTEASEALSTPIHHDEFIAWLSKAYNWNISGSPAPQFSDVPSSNPYASQISTAIMQGWLPNTGKLYPSNSLTRIEAVKWIIDWLGWSGPAAHETFFKVPFSDNQTMSASDVGAATMAVDTGMFSLDNGAFKPDGTVTVGQAAVALTQAVHLAIDDANNNVQ